MKPNPYFKNTMRDINAVTPILEGVVNHALDFGVSPKGLNLSNAWSRCERAIRDLVEAQSAADELGYSSLRIALKALKQFKQTQVTGLSDLPELFHKVPNIWLSGKVDSRKSEGFKPMSLSAALRKHRVITPLLVEAWQLANGDEAVYWQIEREYLTVSAEDFEKALYRYINDLEEVTLEEEFSNVLPATEEEIERIYEHMLDPNRIYGVVPKEQFSEQEGQ